LWLWLYGDTGWEGEGCWGYLGCCCCSSIEYLERYEESNSEVEGARLLEYAPDDLWLELFTEGTADIWEAATETRGGETLSSSSL